MKLSLRRTVLRSIGATTLAWGLFVGPGTALAQDVQNGPSVGVEDPVPPDVPTRRQPAIRQVHRRKPILRSPPRPPVAH